MGLLPDTQNCGCACAGNAGNVFPVTAGKRSRHASRHVRDARAVIYAGIANYRFPLKSAAGGKRSWHSRRMRNLQFYVSGNRPIHIFIVCFGFLVDMLLIISVDSVISNPHRNNSVSKVLDILLPDYVSRGSQHSL